MLSERHLLNDTKLFLQKPLFLPSKTKEELKQHIITGHLCLVPLMPLPAVQQSGILEAPSFAEVIQVALRIFMLKCSSYIIFSVCKVTYLRSHNESSTPVVEVSGFIYKSSCISQKMGF